MRKTVEMSFFYFRPEYSLVFLCFETRELELWLFIQNVKFKAQLVVLGEWVFVFPT